MQAAAQKWVCHAISNTTNLPEDVDVETVKDVYMTGWELGCKGVTVYREGSRAGVLISSENKKKDKTGCKRNGKSIVYNDAPNGQENYHALFTLQISKERAGQYL